MTTDVCKSKLLFLRQNKCSFFPFAVPTCSPLLDTLRQAHPLLADVEDGVELADEDVAEDPERVPQVEAHDARDALGHAELSHLRIDRQTNDQLKHFLVSKVVTEAPLQQDELHFSKTERGSLTFPAFARLFRRS